jgi:hypothetical protein
VIYVGRETSVCSCNNPVSIPYTVYFNFLVQLRCKRETEGALLKCNRFHGKTTVTSSKFIDLCPHHRSYESPQTFLHVQLRDIYSERNPRVFTHPPLTISMLYVCNAAPCCAMSLNKDNDDCS